MQPLLSARCGGVLFGIDPVSGREDRLVVAAVRGGPDRLVSGEVDGSRYELERSGRQVEVTRGEGGTRLARRHLRELAGLAARTAEVFGGPQDVEWAYEEGGPLRLLQSRPVTAEPRGRPRGPVLGPGPVAETFPAPLQPLEADLWVEPLRTALGRALLLAGTASAADVEASPLVPVVDGWVAVDLDLLEPRHRTPTVRERLDPRPRLRRLYASWRVGRLRSALPSLARDVLAAADTALAGVPPLDDLDERRLVAVLHRLRPALLSVHAHELLVGLLADPDVPRATGTGTALGVLARARAAGRPDAETVAAQPVVLALAPPRVQAASSLPTDVAVPAPGPGAGDRPVTDADDPGLLREALRLRLRWLQEVGARAAWSLGERLAAAGRLPRAEEVRGLRLADLAGLVDDPAAVASPLPVVAGDPLPARFRMSDTNRPVPVGGGTGATGAGGGTGTGPVHLAILAREAVVPTVVGAAGALERFAPGTVVQVDGATGEVAEQDGA